MSDDRFTWLHLPLETSLNDVSDDTDFWGVHLVEDRFDEVVWDLLPPYQDEDDESMLPSAAHPSYPYGNPYAPSASRSGHWSSSNPFPSSTTPSSLRTAYRSGFPLPSLTSRTHSTSAPSSAWTDLALGQLLPGSRREGYGVGRDEDEEAGEGGPTGQEQQQDAPPAAPTAAGAGGQTNGVEGVGIPDGVAGVLGGEEGMDEDEEEEEVEELEDRENEN